MTQKAEINDGHPKEADTKVVSMFSSSIYFLTRDLEQELFDVMHRGIKCDERGTEECMSCIGRQIIVFLQRNPEQLSTFLFEFREQIDEVFGSGKAEELLDILCENDY